MICVPHLEDGKPAHLKRFLLENDNLGCKLEMRFG